MKNTKTIGSESHIHVLSLLVVASFLSLMIIYLVRFEDFAKSEVHPFGAPNMFIRAFCLFLHTDWSGRQFT